MNLAASKKIEISFFIFVTNNPNVKGLNIFKREFLNTFYAVETTFFIRDRNSLIELISELNTFSNFSGLKPEKTKCEILGIGVLQEVQVALCGMKCINLNDKTVFIFRIIKIFCEHSVKIENILKLWRMRQLTLEGRITVSKSFF